MKQAVAAVHESLHGTKRTSPPRRSTLALSPIRDTLIEGFSHFVTSMTAPIASGWSGCRVGFAPTGKRSLCTAHTRDGLSLASLERLHSATVFPAENAHKRLRAFFSSVTYGGGAVPLPRLGPRAVSWSNELDASVALGLTGER
jgi:hypothetical protein